ncbi:hypothetical protein BpHYR1_015136 [Brachionus plicatilis]|uniref:Uncharacterized protein n=1 Tax=Brachionus plicatilis TaxID=10195 RepID=A0A3M7T6N9_BRAPC|nr:hypothetical protein BpHYR1_015136 [Brachionus plicatilis]
MSDLSKKKIPRSTAFYQRKIKKEKITQAFNLLWPSFHDRQDHNTTPTTSNLSEHKPSNNPDDLTDTEFNRMFEMENFSVKNCFPDNDNGSEELVNLDENIQEKFDKTQTEKTELINMSLLSLFYSGKLSQTGLKQVVQLFKIATNFDIPTSFDKLSNNFLKITNEEIIILILIQKYFVIF